MLTINLQVRKNRIRSMRPEFLTSGSVNTVTCSFDFDFAWSLYDKEAVFRTESEVYTAKIDGNTCVMPPMVLDEVDCVYVGVSGKHDDKTMNTNYTKLVVRQGAHKHGITDVFK